MSKYNNKKVVIDGIGFDSQKEGRRYLELKLLKRGGEISDLTLQPRYDFRHNGIYIGFYKADFIYYDLKKEMWIVEDVKSPATQKDKNYRLKKKMMWAFHTIKIFET